MWAEHGSGGEEDLEWGAQSTMFNPQTFLPLLCHSYGPWHACLLVLWVVKRDHGHTSVGQTLRSAHRPYCCVYSCYGDEGSQWWVRLMLAGLRSPQQVSESVSNPGVTCVLPGCSEEPLKEEPPEE